MAAFGPFPPSPAASSSDGIGPGGRGNLALDLKGFHASGWEGVGVVSGVLLAGPCPSGPLPSGLLTLSSSALVATGDCTTLQYLPFFAHLHVHA